MNRIIFFALGWLGLVGNAAELKLDVDNFVKRMESKYERIGVDNNHFAIAGEIAYVPPLRVIPIFSEKGLKDTLQKCVFIREGMYGEHINEGQQAKLVRKYGRRLWIHRNHLEFTELRNIDLGSILHNNCALSIKHDGTYTVVQGVSLD